MGALRREGRRIPKGVLVYSRCSPDEVTRHAWRSRPTSPGRAVSWIDVVILILMGAALLFGVVKGIVRPLLFELAVIAALVIAYSYQEPLAHALGPRPILRGTALLIVSAVLLTIALAWPARILAGAIVRVPGLTTVDHLAGAAVHGLLGFAALYLVVAALTSLGHALDPLLAGRGELSASQIRRFAEETQRDPVLKVVLEPGALKNLEAEAHQAPVSIRQLERAEGIVDFYVHYVRLPLATSQLAPVVMRVGDRFPVIGRPSVAGLPAAPAF